MGLKVEGKGGKPREVVVPTAAVEPSKHSLKKQALGSDLKNVGPQASYFFAPLRHPCDVELRFWAMASTTAGLAEFTPGTR